MLDSERKGVQQDFVRELQNLLEQYLHKLSPAEVCGLLDFQIHIIAIEIDRMASAKEERVSNGAQQAAGMPLKTATDPQ
jgi:hypothetical protein